MKIVIVENDESWLKRTLKDINKVLNKENLKEKILHFNKYTKTLRDIIYDKS